MTKEVIKIYSVPVIFDKIFDQETYVNIFLKLIQNLSNILSYNSNNNPRIINENTLLEIFMQIIKKI